MKIYKKILIFLPAAILILTVFIIFSGCARSWNSLNEKLQPVNENSQDSSNASEDSQEKTIESQYIRDGNRGKNTITGNISNTKPSTEGTVMIADIGQFDFNPAEIKTLRDDLFKEGYFSIFDILAHLDSSGEISMIYNFDTNLNTHLIESINGVKNWWYSAYYDGGWPERSVFRMDHYPYKDKMDISLVKANASDLTLYYAVFEEETARKKANNGRIIIPEVIIRGPQTGDIIFKDVEVKPHNLRNDMLQDGTVTAIDAIMSLGDEGKISYGLFWYESIGTAQIVKNYWVNGINEDQSYDRCGFVYEEGSLAYYRFTGNHIHIPSDIRIINSPEYLEYFWICI